MLCVLMKILSNAGAKKKTKSRLMGFEFRTFYVIFKWHHDSEGVNMRVLAEER